MRYGIARTVTYTETWEFQLSKKKLRKLLNNTTPDFYDVVDSRHRSLTAVGQPELCRRLKRTKPFELILKSIKHNSVLREMHVQNMSANILKGHIDRI